MQDEYPGQIDLFRKLIYTPQRLKKFITLKRESNLSCLKLLQKWLSRPSLEVDHELILAKPTDDIDVDAANAAIVKFRKYSDMSLACGDDALALWCLINW